MESPCESESSLDGGTMLPPSPVSREQLQKRIESLTQQNKVLKAELDTFKIKCKVIQEENRTLKQASVIIQAKAEQEEEYISNTLLKKIQALKKEKETLAHHYEREEECLTNDLSRKLDQLRQEKCKLEQTLEQEQECLVNKLMRKIEKLQAETDSKQTNLEQLRREMVELENTLEQEQEALVNKLWKRMDKLESEKRLLQIKLDQPVSDPTTPRDINEVNGDTATKLSTHIQNLRSEVLRLRVNLAAAQKETNKKMQRFAQEEKSIREENARLQRKLQLEVERREALCRHLSESESSLEMDEERFYNENLLIGNNPNAVIPPGGLPNVNTHRQRTISSPVSHSPSNSRPLSPGAVQQNRCYACGQIVNRRASERFIKPALPTPMLSLNTSAPNVLGNTSLQASGFGSIVQGGNNTATAAAAASGTATTTGLNSTTLYGNTGGFLPNLGTERLSLGSNSSSGNSNNNSNSSCSSVSGVVSNNIGPLGSFGNHNMLGNSIGAPPIMGMTNIQQHSIVNPLNMNIKMNMNTSNNPSANIMSNSNASLSAFTPTNISNSSGMNTSSTGSNAFAQPASPMDTSVYKE